MKKKMTLWVFNNDDSMYAGPCLSSLKPNKKGYYPDDDHGGIEGDVVECAFLKKMNFPKNKRIKVQLVVVEEK